MDLDVGRACAQVVFVRDDITGNMAFVDLIEIDRRCSIVLNLTHPLKFGAVVKP